MTAPRIFASPKEGIEARTSAAVNLLAAWCGQDMTSHYGTEAAVGLSMLNSSLNRSSHRATIGFIRGEVLAGGRPVTEHELANCIREILAFCATQQIDIGSALVEQLAPSANAQPTRKTA